MCIDNLWIKTIWTELKIRFFLILNFYACDGWKMKCEIVLPGNEMRGEVTEFYFYLTLSIYLNYRTVHPRQMRNCNSSWTTWRPGSWTRTGWSMKNEEGMNRIRSEKVWPNFGSIQNEVHHCLPSLYDCKGKNRCIHSKPLYLYVG